MSDTRPTTAQLLDELTRLRHRVATLEAAAAARQRVATDEPATVGGPVSASQAPALRTPDAAALHASQRRLTTLAAVTQRLTRGLDLPTVLHTVAEAAAQVFGGEAGFRILEGEFLVRRGATPGAQVAMRQERVRLGESLSGRVAASGQMLSSMDVGADPRVLSVHQAASQPMSTGALLCVPVALEDQVLGTLNIYHERGHVFTPEECAIATTLAQQAAIAMDNARLFTALRAQQARLQAIVETAVDAVITIDEQGIIETCNAATERLFGYAAADMIGQNVRLLMPPPYRDEHDGYLERYHRTGEPHIIGIGREVFGQRQDGTIFSMALAVSEMWLGERRLFTGIVHDLTAYRQAQEALRASEARYHTLVDSVPSLMWTTRPDGMAEYVNPRWREYTGQTVEQAAALGWAAIVHPDDRRQCLVAWQHAVETGEPYALEARLRRHDGVYRWFLERAVPMRDEGGQIVAWLGTSTDIDDQKRAEAQLQQAHDALEQQVHARTAALSAANAELRRFAYLMSHDLRAPLVNLKGFAGELRLACGVLQRLLPSAGAALEAPQRQELVTVLEQDLPEALAFIDASVTRMDRLLRAVLHLSRAGQCTLHLEDIDVAALVHNIVQSLTHQLTVHQATVTLGALPVIRADRTALEQIFGNLLSNAVKYLLPGRPGLLTITAEEAPYETCFQVQDNGRGIAPHDIPTVFELFRRVGPQDTEGEGIGLTYVQTLVRRHGGEIVCQSTPGEGTTFRFTIAKHLAADDPSTV